MDPVLLARIAKLSDLSDLLLRLGSEAITRGDTERAHDLGKRFIRVEEVLTRLFGDLDAQVNEPEPEPEVRKHADGVGFTPFAWRHLLHDTGFASDHEVRPYIIGCPRPVRERIETRTTLTLAFQFYTGRESATHLWVQYSDGKRHLVHRKAS